MNVHLISSGISFALMIYIYTQMSRYRQSIQYAYWSIAIAILHIIALINYITTNDQICSIKSAAGAGFFAWAAYNVWKHNRPKKHPKRATSRITIRNGRLAVIPNGAS